MKVAFCNVQEFNPTIGGIERVSVSLATELVKNGIDVIFISCRKSPYSKPYELPAKQYSLPNSEDYNVQNVGVTAEILSDEKVNIVINQNAHSYLFHKQCKEACDKVHTKLISVLHFNPDMRVKSHKNMIDWRFFSFKENIKYAFESLILSWPFTYITMYDQRKLYRALYNDSDATILLSPQYFNSFAKIAGIKDLKKLKAIPNMLSFPYEEKLYEKDNTILFCSRLVPQKNPYRVLYIWEKIQDSLPLWKLQIVGDGIWTNRLKIFAKKLNLERIEFCGFQEPKVYYKKSKIFILTSNFEGWGLTLTEAMQYGCIPIAFNSYESIGDIIENENNGFLIKPFIVEDMVETIISLANNINSNKIAKNAMNSMTRYMPNVIMKHWENLFIQLLNK